MKKSLKLISPRFLILSLLALTGFCLESHAGWEVGGGDVYALKFVKAARMIAEDVSKNPNCPLRQSINIDEFKQAIEKVEVSTSNEDIQVDEKKINVNRRTWPFMTKRAKLETVLKSYTQHTSKPFTDALTEATEQSCFTSGNWRKIFSSNSSGLEDRNSNLVISQDVALTAKQLLARLNSEPDAEVLKRFDLCKLQSAMTHTHAQYWNSVKKAENTENCDSASDTAQHVSVETAPIALKFGGGEIKDGLNFKKGHSAEVLINRSLWRQMNRGQRMELLLHEYLSVIGSNDKHYQISSLLFRDLPVQDYTN